MATALQIAQEAYRRQNLISLTTLSSALEFPHNIALDVLNEVIRFANRLGNYWFTETRTALAYSPGQYQYNLTDLGIDPLRIRWIRAEAANKWANLNQYDYPTFQRLFRSSTIQTGQPNVWAKYNDVLELAGIPDQDYGLAVYHFRDMPLITADGDEFLVPERDEDILIQCVFQMLGYYIGKWDIGTAQQAMRLLWTPFLVDINQDAGLPSVMPAMF